MRVGCPTTCRQELAELRTEAPELPPTQETLTSPSEHLRAPPCHASLQDAKDTHAPFLSLFVLLPVLPVGSDTQSYFNKMLMQLKFAFCSSKFSIFIIFFPFTIILPWTAKNLILSCNPSCLIRMTPSLINSGVLRS